MSVLRSNKDSFKEAFYSIRSTPPMRPFDMGENSKGIALVFPFYMVRREGWAASLAYGVKYKLSDKNILIKIMKTVSIKNRYPVTVESPDLLQAFTLKKLYSLAPGDENDDWLPGIMTCRDPYIKSGMPVEGQLAGIIFENNLPENPYIYLITGSAKLDSGSCYVKRSSSSNSSSWFNINVLYVSNGRHESTDEAGDICPSTVTSIGGKGSNPISITVMGADSPESIVEKLRLTADSLYCYPIYPPKVAMGNKFYPTMATILTSSIESGLGYGASFDILVGSLFVSSGATASGLELGDLEPVRYYKTHFIPSPALLSASGDENWHDNALTVRALNIPVVRIKVAKSGSKGETLDVRNIIINQISESLTSSVLRGVTEIVHENGIFISINKNLIKSILDELARLGITEKSKSHFERDLARGLKTIYEMRDQDKIKLVQLGSTGSRLVGENYVDPKLIAKALLNELVVYPLIRQHVNIGGDNARYLTLKLSAITYKRVALIEEPLSEFIGGEDIKHIQYAHATMNFVPARLHAAIYWALSKNAGKPRANVLRVLRDTGLVVLSWALMAFAYAWSSVGTNTPKNVPPLKPIQAISLAEKVGYFSVLAGAHGLAHIASQAIADSLGISKPDLYMRELTRMYIGRESMHEGLQARISTRDSAILVDGALLVAPASRFGADISIGVAQEGLYSIVKNGGANIINNPGDLCGELVDATGPYQNGNCMRIWELSHRGYLAASLAAPLKLKRVADEVLEPFDLAGNDMTMVFYPTPEIATYLIERMAKIEGVPADEVKAYAGQLAKAKLPLCFDGCEMCVMSDECPLISSPVQQFLVSRSAAHILCKNISKNSENLD